MIFCLRFSIRFYLNFLNSDYLYLILLLLINPKSSMLYFFFLHFNKILSFFWFLWNLNWYKYFLLRPKDLIFKIESNSLYFTSLLILITYYKLNPLFFMNSNWYCLNSHLHLNFISHFKHLALCFYYLKTIWDYFLNFLNCFQINLILCRSQVSYHDFKIFKYFHCKKNFCFVLFWKIVVCLSFRFLNWPYLTNTLYFILIWFNLFY